MGWKTEDDNLWALCSECNEGKKNYFASVTEPEVRSAMLHKSVHVRLGELLKAFAGKPVPKMYLEMVSAFTHDDFSRRLRELRDLGWRYRVQKRKEENRVRTYYILEQAKPWPDTPEKSIGERVKRKGESKPT